MNYFNRHSVTEKKAKTFRTSFRTTIILVYYILPFEIYKKPKFYWFCVKCEQLVGSSLYQFISFDCNMSHHHERL